MSIFTKFVSAVCRPTSNIDDYLADIILPQLQKDASLLDKHFGRAKFYPFNDKSNIPKSLTVLMQELCATKKKQQQNSDTCKNSEDENNNNTSKRLSFKDIHNRVSVSNVDCLLRAKQFHDEKCYKNIGVLNMANEFNCGGAWSVHFGSQEEYLFRNSTLPFSLWRHRRLEQDAFRAWEAGTNVLGPAQEKDRWYPFPIFGGVYSDPVEVFSVEDKVLSKMDPPQQVFNISVLTIAAQDLRNKNAEFPKQVFNLEILAGKMRTLFLMAIENGVDCLVLSALGSGAFLNPPEEVAKMFKFILDELAAGCDTVEDFPFKRIDFAIIKSRENLVTYQKVFAEG